MDLLRGLTSRPIQKIQEKDVGDINVVVYCILSYHKMPLERDNVEQSSFKSVVIGPQCANCFYGLFPRRTHESELKDLRINDPFRVFSLYSDHTQSRTWLQPQ